MTVLPPAFPEEAQHEPPPPFAAPYEGPLVVETEVPC